MAAALSNGFTVNDFYSLTIGQILDCLKEFIPPEDRIYKASQNDIDLL